MDKAIEFLPILRTLINRLEIMRNKHTVLMGKLAMYFSMGDMGVVDDEARTKLKEWFKEIHETMQDDEELLKQMIELRDSIAGDDSSDTPRDI